MIGAMIPAKKGKINIKISSVSLSLAHQRSHEQDENEKQPKRQKT